ncbi:SRPBCC family protein [soil metagenome]
MTTISIQHQPDLARDLVLERVIDIRPEQVWAAWTTPELIKQWFTPVPWKTIDCEIDLRPGGIFRTVMQSPEGQEFTNTGCILEVVENAKLVWTGALKPGYRPYANEEAADFPFLFTAVITMAVEANGTRYTALAIHPDEEARAKHDAMGFNTGWGIALDQLVAVMKRS